MSTQSDVIVVGSGASAVHSVYSIVKAGYRVTMLDVGFEDSGYEALIPSASFVDIRGTDSMQHRYFLGDQFEGIPLGKVGTGPQITPPRQYVIRRMEALTPFESSGFNHFESLALGGLGGAWGAVCHPYLDHELSKCSIPTKDFQLHYETVAKRIGISGSSNDLESFYGKLDGLQPPLEIDSNAELIFSRYRQRSKKFNHAGIYMGRPLMAVITQPLKGRLPHLYHDMDFWSNKGRSVYRPDITVRELQRYGNFTYNRSFFVERFSEEKSNKVKLYAKSIKNEKYEVFETRRLILAAGALGTTRIVLRSLDKYDVPVPFTCNRHTYIPCINFRAFGKHQKERRHSLAQLVMIYDPTGDSKSLVLSQLYSYGSLLLFRLLKDSSFPCRESLRILRSLASSLVILVIQHEDEICSGKYCVLCRRSDRDGDYLEIIYKPPAETLLQQKANEKAIAHQIRKLGCWPIKMVHPGHGSSIHYASQFPMTPTSKPLTTKLSGLLRSTKMVYIADSSSFAYLPAKGLTFTLMANANRIGENILKEL